MVEGSRLGCSGPICTSHIAGWPEADGAGGVGGFDRADGDGDGGFWIGVLPTHYSRGIESSTPSVARQSFSRSAARQHFTCHILLWQETYHNTDAACIEVSV